MEVKPKLRKSSAEYIYTENVYLQIFYGRTYFYRQLSSTNKKIINDYQVFSQINQEKEEKWNVCHSIFGNKSRTTVKFSQYNANLIFNIQSQNIQKPRCLDRTLKHENV